MISTSLKLIMKDERINLSLFLQLIVGNHEVVADLILILLGERLYFIR